MRVELFFYNLNKKFQKFVFIVNLTTLDSKDIEILHIFFNEKIKCMKTDDSLVVTSGLAFNMLDIALKNEDIRLLPVKNVFFGGNIACAGLLTVDDILLATEEEKPFSHLLLPSIMFDENLLDLKGRSCRDIVNTRGCKCDII